MQRRSLMITAPSQVEWHEDTLPPPGPGEILVKTLAGAISVGAEMPQYLGKERELGAADFPSMSGYENLAEVVACGEGVENFSVGDRLIGHYGHRSAALIPADRAAPDDLPEQVPVPVPADVPGAGALLVLLASDAAKGVSKMPLQIDKRIVITGAGVIGLMTLFNLRARGCYKIDVVDPLLERHPLAQALGAARVMTPDDPELTREKYDFGFECSSHAKAFEQLQSRIRHYGSICVTADGNLEPLTLMPHFHHRELTIVGSSDGIEYAEYGRWFWPHLLKHYDALMALYQVKISADELPETFARIADKTISPVKVLVRYGDWQED